MITAYISLALLSLQNSPSLSETLHWLNTNPPPPRMFFDSMAGWDIVDPGAKLSGSKPNDVALLRKDSYFLKPPGTGEVFRRYEVLITPEALDTVESKLEIDERIHLAIIWLATRNKNPGIRWRLFEETTTKFTQASGSTVESAPSWPAFKEAYEMSFVFHDAPQGGLAEWEADKKEAQAHWKAWQTAMRLLGAKAGRPDPFRGGKRLAKRKNNILETNGRSSA